MKKLLFLIVSLLLTSLTAQEINVEVLKSEVFKDERRKSYLVALDKDDKGGVVVIRSYPKGYYIEHYDKDFKLINEYDYKIRGSNVLGTFVFENDINMIEVVYNETLRSYDYIANSASLADFEFNRKVLFRIESKKVKRARFFSLFSGRLDSDYISQYIINKSKTSFAITVDIKNKEKETHQLFLFDSKLNKKLDYTFKRDIKDRKFIYENIEISKNGDAIYLLGKAYTEEKKKKTKGGKYQYELYRISNGESKKQVFDTEEHFSGSLKVILNNNKLICVGFYSDKKDNRYKGLSYFELNPTTLEINTSKYNPFTKQFILDKYGKEKEKELKNLSFRDIHITDKNEIIFNAEEFYVSSWYVANQYGGGTWNHSYNYNDIVSAMIDAQGNLKWARNINKNQVSGGVANYISYTSLTKNNNTYFIINSSDEIKSIKNNRVQFGQASIRKSNLNVLRIDEEGNFDYKELLNSKNNEVPFMVGLGIIDATSGEAFFLGRKGPKKQLLKLMF
ncbi:hypothetical protein GTQ40_12380 [Flavobacteriaceae bacterium R38]|nr:hypothetical protein [Flavobacteriaceae bacterium R38]